MTTKKKKNHGKKTGITRPRPDGGVKKRSIARPRPDGGVKKKPRKKMGITRPRPDGGVMRLHVLTGLEIDRSVRW